MSFVEDPTDPEWKVTKIKSECRIKQELSLSKTKYSQKFCEKWLNIFHPWLARCDDDANKPFCRACQCRLDCNRCHLQRHERTTKHARNLEILINKGEGAARQNLSIRQERSKYYQQRKKMSTSLASSQDASDFGMDAASEDFIDDADGETNFHFVQTAAAPDNYGEETVLKQENISIDDRSDPLPSSKNHMHVSGSFVKKGIKKERMKLLMQIQKDKNDLMDSFKELVSGSYQQSPPREKNHVDLFFESVSSSVKALSPKLIAETKMRVSQLICELELRALTENDVNSSGVAGASAAVVVSPETGAVTSAAYVINTPVATVVHHSAGVHALPQNEDGQQHYEALS